MSTAPRRQPSDAKVVAHIAHEDESFLHILAVSGKRALPKMLRVIAATAVLAMLAFLTLRHG